jgi:hypothetical protein
MITFTIIYLILSIINGDDREYMEVYKRTLG